MPCCFALLDSVAYTAVDGKPKSTLALRRIDNIVAHSAVCLLIDHYEEDWSALWWVRLTAPAACRLSHGGRRSEAGLVAKYPQYGQLAIPGPVIALDIQTWTAWP